LILRRQVKATNLLLIGNAGAGIDELALLAIDGVI
jgi:hypothetical protein